VILPSINCPQPTLTAQIYPLVGIGKTILYINMEFDSFNFITDAKSLLQLVRDFRDSLVTYMQEGGMPECFKLPDSETKRHYISNLRDTGCLYSERPGCN
jgi:predicted AAA+ superfamily ATPase